MLSAETARRLACDATICEMRHGPTGELVPGRKSRAVSAALRRALLARDGTRCAFPGCGCRARDAHHVVPWGEDGPTLLPNLLGVCKLHHVLVHEGGWRVEALPDGRFRFLRPGGTEVLPSPPLPAMTYDPVVAIHKQWMPPGVTFTPESGLPTWQGETVDYEWATQELLWRAEQR